MAANAVGTEVVVRAGTVVSAVVACGCGATTAGATDATDATGATEVTDDTEDTDETDETDDTACGAGAMTENWPIEAEVDEVVATAGGGIACAGAVCTCGGGTSTCAAEVEDDKIREVLVVLVCVLMSVLGNAVHLLPPMDVMKAPRGRFGLVAISKGGVVYRVAIPVATRRRYTTHCATGAKPPFKGANEAKTKASWAIKLEPTSSRSGSGTVDVGEGVGIVLTSRRGVRRGEETVQPPSTMRMARKWFC